MLENVLNNYIDTICVKENCIREIARFVEENKILEMQECFDHFSHLLQLIPLVDLCRMLYMDECIIDGLCEAFPLEKERHACVCAITHMLNGSVQSKEDIFHIVDKTCKILNGGYGAEYKKQFDRAYDALNRNNVFSIFDTYE